MQLDTFVFLRKMKKLLLLMFCVYQGLTSFRLNYSRSHQILFSNCRCLIFIFLFSWKMDPTV